MIDKLSHTTIYVLNQDSAKAFYTEKLGFEVRQDARMGDFRWLTVGPKDQDDLELVLMSIDGAPNLGESRDVLRDMVRNGKLGAGVFATRDCRKTHAELKAKGVTFISDPAERPYGVEALFVDDSGNTFSLTERKPFTG